MDKKRLASELLRLAKELVSAKKYRLLRDARFPKLGFDLSKGTELEFVEFSKSYPYVIRLRTPDGKIVSFLLSNAYNTLSGFSRLPSINTLAKWNMDGVAKAVDGSRVEPDGFSPKGAPSWLLVMGFI